MSSDQTRFQGVRRFGNGRLRKRLGVIITIAGLAMYLVGADPAMFGVDRSPVTGVIQILVFLIGLAFICLGGYMSLSRLWDGYQKTIAADIGLRLVSTGYVIAVGSGMADIFGFGTQAYPRLAFFGTLQEVGVMLGEAVIAFGFLLMIPFQKRAKQT